MSNGTRSRARRRGNPGKRDKLDRGFWHTRGRRQVAGARDVEGERCPTCSDLWAEHDVTGQCLVCDRCGQPVDDGQ